MTVKEYELLFLAKYPPEKAKAFVDGCIHVWMVGEPLPIIYPPADTWIEYIPAQPGQKDGE